MTIERLWDAIVEYAIATEEELQLVTAINGYTEEALNSVIYARTGYRTFEQYFECEFDTQYEVEV